MPQSNRNTHIFNGKPPRLRVNLSVGHHSFSRSSPGPPLTFKNSFKGRRIRIRRAAGDREHSKVVDTEIISDSIHKAWPISQLPIGLQARGTNTRAVS